MYRYKSLKVDNTAYNNAPTSSIHKCKWCAILFVSDLEFIDTNIWRSIIQQTKMRPPVTYTGVNGVPYYLFQISTL